MNEYPEISGAGVPYPVVECSCAYVAIGHGLRQRKSDPDCPVHSPDEDGEVERDRDDA